MKLSDLTEEQAIEIGKLLFPDKDMIDFNFRYQAKFECCDHHSEDEHITLTFLSTTYNPAIVNRYMVRIFDNLSCYLYYLQPETETTRAVWITLPTCNQYEIQQKFQAWNLTPTG